MILELEISTVWYPIFCGKTSELQMDQDEIEVTHVNSGINREYVPGMSSFTVNHSGVTVLDNTENRIALSYLVQEAQRRQILSYRLTSTDQDGNTQAITFDAFLRNAVLSRDITQWSQSNISLRVTGGVSFTTVEPPGTPTCEQEPTIYTTLAEAATTVVSALLIPGVGETITILHVSRSGSTYYETSGTPGNLEFAYDDSTGTISFMLEGNPAAPDLEPISIEYKIET